MSGWLWPSGSEEAGAVLHGALAKREYAGFLDTFAGEGSAVLTVCGYATDVFSVLFAVDPLKEHVEQEVAAKNAKRQKHGNRHRTSRGPVCMTSADEQSVCAWTLKSPEQFMRNLLAGLSPKQAEKAGNETSPLNV
jgi:hypothetical protein